MNLLMTTLWPNILSAASVRFPAESKELVGSFGTGGYHMAMDKARRLNIPLEQANVSDVSR